MDRNLYQDIAQRTNGDIYVGVVGPVRTGKSTFIKRFMELMVLPRITDSHILARTRDELPQSADGRTVMTTQPKFVPAEACQVQITEEMRANIRMIDCVGYMVDGALGASEGARERMVKTPWSDEEMPFEKAAAVGTYKVIREHSTIGVVVTSDGSITDIARAIYIEAEQRVVNELKEAGKPFVVVLNTRTPEAGDTRRLADALAERYGVAVLAKDVANMTENDVQDILSAVLYEFPIRTIEANLPTWMSALGAEHPLIADCIATLATVAEESKTMRDVVDIGRMFVCDSFTACSVVCRLGEGVVDLNFEAAPQLYLQVLSACCGVDATDESALLRYIIDLSCKAHFVAKLSKALEQVEETGYGIVEPTIEQMQLEEPEIMRQAGRFGVRLKASAPSLHIMRVDVRTEVSPIVGSEQQSEELVKYLLSEFESNKTGIWQTNMFGKSLESLVNEGLNNKLNSMPKDAPVKMRKTLGRIINEGKGGMICILL